MTMTTTGGKADSKKTAQIQALSKPGGRGRAACVRVAEFAGELATAIRRAVPFLSRKRIAITAEEPYCVSFADLAADETIVHSSPFSIATTTAPNARGLVLIEELALSRLLDGVLGGDGAVPAMASESPTKQLTSAQMALASRVSATMLRAFADVLNAHLKVVVTPTAAKEIEPGAAVMIALALDGGGRILIALPMSVIPAAQAEAAQDDEKAAPAKPKIDPNIAFAMNEVELDIVVELGKVRLPLRMIADLKVGDVVRLGLPLDERARVSAGGAELFQGRPTASGDVVAVMLERQLA